MTELINAGNKIMNLIQFNNVYKSFQGPDGNVVGLDDITFSLSKNELLVIRGASGCGKTTLLLAAGGMLAPDKGSIYYMEQEIYKLTPEKRGQLRAKKFGFVFQQFHLIPYLSVRENILMPGLAWPQENIYKSCDKLIDQFGLTDRKDHISTQLSVGEKQRTAFARALINKPDIILADEPTGNLDEKNADVVLNYFKMFVQQGGSALLVTHDSKADAHATRVIQMAKGAIN